MEESAGGKEREGRKVGEGEGERKGRKGGGGRGKTDDSENKPYQSCMQVVHQP